LYIETEEQLDEFVRQSMGCDCLAIDTEFHREKTYYPQLCLLQLAVRQGEGVQCFIVDPLSVGDLGRLSELMANPQTTKVLHAGDQDLAILYHALGMLPRPLFDTQRAATLLGHVQQQGLATLVKSYCDVSLDKSNSFTDWARRPLTKEQIAYAYNDVRYLPEIFSKMRQRLVEMGRLSWLDEEFERLSDPATYDQDPGDLWQRVKHSVSLRPQELNVLRELAIWREQAAQRHDYPRKWVLSDELMIELAKRQPQNEADVYLIRGAKEKLGRKWAQEVLKAVRRAQSQPKELWPERPARPSAPRGKAAQMDLLTALARQRAHENDIAFNVLAPRDELAALSGGQRRGLQLLQGWRKRLVGEELLALLGGQLSLSLDGDNLMVTKQPRTD